LDSDRDRRDQSDWREVLDDVVAGIGRHARARRCHQDGVAVGRSFRRRADADYGTCAGPVLDNDLLAERRRELGGGRLAALVQLARQFPPASFGGWRDSLRRRPRMRLQRSSYSHHRARSAAEHRGPQQTRQPSTEGRGPQQKQPLQAMGWRLMNLDTNMSRNGTSW
jgi:hypothetical protein